MTDSDSHILAVGDRLTAVLREVQAEILKGFYAVAEIWDTRLTSLEREISALKDDVASMESRITAVEKRLDLPAPPAA